MSAADWLWQLPASAGIAVIVVAAVGTFLEYLLDTIHPVRQDARSIAEEDARRLLLSESGQHQKKDASR